jgi:nucleoside-diphosphate-sugar epimerase
MTYRYVMLTGATGYIGARVLARLQSMGVPVKVLARRAQTSGIPQSDWTVAEDIAAPDLLRRLLPDCQAVVHLAGRAHVFREACKPGDAYQRANTDLTEALATASAEAGVERFVFMSTAKVYGEASTHPLTERDTPVPTDAYGRSKLDAESRIKAICTGSRMTYAIIRSPMVYGPNCIGNVRRLAGALRRRLPMPFATSDNRRSVIAVDNLVDVLIRCTEHANAANETFVAADPAPLSTRQLVERLAAGMGIAPWLVPFPKSLLKVCGHLLGRGAEIERLTGTFEFDTGHLQTRLGWSPVVSSLDALAATGRSFRSGAK